MSSSKSNGGLSSGHFCKGESACRCWVQTLSHLSLINCLPKTVASTATHRDLALAQRLADEKAIAVNSWLEEMEPFDKINAQNIFVSFSTGFISKDGDSINPEKALESGRKLQVQLDGNIPTATLERKLKVKSLAALRQYITKNPTMPVNALKYFNHLVIFAQRENNLEIILVQHELTQIPMSLFSQKDQLMYGEDKASFAQRCLKDNITPINIQERMTDTSVVDGGWLLRQTRWEKGFKQGNIIDGYVQFDGYQSSTIDHTHRRRQKQFCNEMK